jgi:hypothetical protein
MPSTPKKTKRKTKQECFKDNDPRIRIHILTNKRLSQDFQR